MKKAIALYSGGLDSMLAIGLMQRAGVSVIPITFVTPFHNPYSKSGQMDTGKLVRQYFGLELEKYPLDDELLELIRHPRHGRGKNINPCIDCHLLMIRKAGQIMQERGADFIVTGEVLGQRPMSQHKQALELIARKSGLEGLLVRPLSAKLLMPTLPQTEGWIADDYLLDMGGRGRKRQIAMATEWGITDYSTPAGGCLLTDPGYARKLGNLLVSDMMDVENCHWIQFGRFFDLGPGCKLVVARNESECQRIMDHAREDDDLIMPLNGKGPTALLRGEQKSEGLETAERIVAYYCKPKGPIELVINPQANREKIKTAVAADEVEVRRFLVG